MPRSMSPDARTVITEILEDILTGSVPRTVASFSELHDHVDANEYILAAPGFRSVYDDSDSADDWLPTGNALTLEVDAWIRVGVLRTADNYPPSTPCPSCGGPVWPGDPECCPGDMTPR